MAWKFTHKKKVYENPETYYSFCFIDVNWINTCQVKSLNVTICNYFFKWLKEKR